ncbi:acyltransferase family protein [Parablautia muri]|uniref:Acyltransferase n=1 Tax=Parablautia muri TaxID=2320879 RepID=A0A9X5BFX9_9FIRM|nr:acyltransferase family protein [Parablautia muri]NBJ93078.1 acyltransferase [Parablautia muri]
MKTNTGENRQFRILSALGIILVVVGHLGYNLLDIGGLFPYYSFHVFIFLFVSGYFYKEQAQEDIVGYILKKCVTLMVPYFLWNLFYGILAQVLHKVGFSFGENLSFKTLFLSPFLDGHQFLYNFSAWFVPALFLIEIINVVMRKALEILHLKNEWLILAVCLLLGMVTVQLAIGGHVWGLYKLPGRLLLMLPGFQMGRIYREKLEIHDTLPDGIYFLIVIGAQVFISIFCAGLAFGAVWVGSFANGPVVPYLTVMTGIAFWLRIAKIIGSVPNISEKLVYIGRNTYSIMMHHAAVFVLVNGAFYLCSLLTPLCKEFDREMFFYDIGYVYLAGGTEGSKWIFLLAGIGVPLLIEKGVIKLKMNIKYGSGERK